MTTAADRAERTGSLHDRPEDADPAGSVRTADLIRRWALALFVAQRLAVVATATTPWVTPDEYGSWAVAAALVTGDAPITMRDMPTYSLLSGLTLAPIEALGLDPTLAYRLATLWLAGLVLAAAWMIRAATRRLCPGRPVAAAASFALVLLFPATTVTTSFTWAETVVLVWWAAFLLVSVRGVGERDHRWILGGSAVVGLAPVVHGRLSLVPLIWVGALVGIAVRQRSVRTCAAGAALTLAVAALGLRLQGAVADRVWDRERQVGGAFDLSRPKELGGWLLAAGAGQVWYLLVASVGLGAVGLVVLVTWARRRPGAVTATGEGQACTVDRAGFARVLGASMASVLAVSVLFMTRQLSTTSPGSARFGGMRWDHLVYGRYVDAVVVILAVLGLTGLLAARRERPGPTSVLVAAGITSTSLAGSIWMWTRHVGLGDRLELTIAGVTWLPLRSGGLDLLGWTVAGLVVVGALVVAVRRSQRAVVVVLAGWLVVASCLATATAIEHHADRTHPELVATLGTPATGAEQVVLPSDVEALSLWRLGVFAQQRDLVHRGWQPHFVDRDSADLGARPGGDAGALVLLDDVRPVGADWTSVAQFGGATVWRRTGR